MRNSGYKLIAALGIVAAIAAIGFGVWSVSSSPGNFISGSTGTANLDSDTREVSSATRFDIEGFWDVHLTSGKPALSFHADKDQLKNIKFAQDGGNITIRQTGLGMGRPIKVEISMPNPNDISFQGAGSLELDNFKLKDLRLHVKGGTSVRMNDSTVENLDLSSEGACNIDLDGAVVTNANVNLSGASNATLNMNGGTLGGLIEGVGHLSYAGTVSEETVRTDGLAKVEKK